MSSADPASSRRAAAETRALIRRTAVDLYGAIATDEPIEGMAIATRPALDDPLTGVRAAERVRRLALGQIREWVDAARAAGRTWDDVADALGLDDGEEFGPSRALAAFDWIVDGRPPADPDPDPWSSCKTSSIRWTCAACGCRVTDSGPFSSHPDDQEHGHALGCPRRAAALAEHRREWDQ